MNGVWVERAKDRHWSSSVSVGRYFIVSGVVLSFVFAWLEPAGSRGIGLFLSFLLWLAHMTLLFPLLIFLQIQTQHFSRLAGKQVSPWMLTGLAALIGGLLFVPVAHFLDLLFAVPDPDAGSSLLENLLDEAGGVVIPVVATWIAINAPWILELDFRRADSEEAPSSEAPKTSSNREGASSDSQRATTASKSGPSPFLDLLEGRFTGKLISLSSELHYLRVTTTTGEGLVLYNLRDAVSELPQEAGIQIHRSHWVATKQVERIVRRDKASYCRLSNGGELPISRRKQREVRERIEQRVPMEDLGIRSESRLES